MTWDSVNDDRFSFCTELSYLFNQSFRILHLKLSFSLSLFFSLQLSVKILSHQALSTHTALSHTHKGHYVKRCGPLDGRQCNQLIKSCFDHQHQSVSAWRAPESLVWFGRVLWPSQWPTSCDMDRCLSIRLLKGCLEPCHEFLHFTWSAPCAFCCHAYT